MEVASRPTDAAGVLLLVYDLGQPRRSGPERSENPHPLPRFLVDRHSLERPRFRRVRGQAAPRERARKDRAKRDLRHCNTEPPRKMGICIGDGQKTPRPPLFEFASMVGHNNSTLGEKEVGALDARRNHDDNGDRRGHHG